jgi:hypothetical protein
MLATDRAALSSSSASNFRPVDKRLFFVLSLTCITRARAASFASSREGQSASLVAVSQVAITIVWEARHHELSFFVSAIPVFFFFLSFVPFAILNPDHYKWWKVIRLVVQWTLMAFGLLLLAWWDPIPTSPTIKEFTDKFMKGTLGVVLAWTWVLVVAGFVAKTIQAEWPSLLGPPPPR